MRRVILLSLLAAIPMTATAREGEQRDAKKEGSQLVAHEWGTFTTIAGKDGGSLDWRPLTGHADLPKFVYTQKRGWNGRRFLLGKRRFRTRVRMETPVIYFYTPVQREVSVKVGFPGGTITEWYPRAKTIRNGIDWGKFLLVPNKKVQLLREESYNHYYPARETDASVLQVCSNRPPNYEYEKFLFYRGVGKFSLPLKARLVGEDEVRVENVGPARIAQAIRFERRGDRIRYSIRCYLDAEQGEVSLARGEGSSLDGLQRDLLKILRTQGLYQKEARAMLKTWEDHWFTEGTRVFYTVPRAETDRILPLTIEPRPDELVRVLIGRIELITPARRKTMRQLALQLGSQDAKLRATAQKGLATFGRFAEPTLREVRASLKDSAHRARLKKLIDG